MGIEKIKKSEERVGAYATKKAAKLAANIETQRTGLRYIVVQTYCWRNGGRTKKACWTTTTKTKKM